MDCPFCGERDFDPMGLKKHLIEWCEPFNNVPDISHHGPRWCEKVRHGKFEKYIHGDDFDGAFQVNGILYCGRCHRAI